MAVGGDGGAVVGDDDDGGVGAGGIEAPHEQLGGVGVEGAVEFVEDHDGAGAKECAGDGDALCLSFTESSAGFVAGCVETEGEVEDEVGDGGVQHVGELFFGGVGVGEKEVVAD